MKTKYKKIISLVSCILFCEFSFCHAGQSGCNDVKPVTEEKILNEKKTQSKGVLFISSYTLDWKTVPEQISGIEDSIYSYANITCEYLNTKNIKYTDARKQELFEHFSSTYTADQFDLIISGDDDALDFCLTYHNTLFPNAPLVFEGVNDLTLAEKASKEDYCTGVLERISYMKNLDFAFSLLPNAKKVNVLYDDTNSGQGEYKQFVSEASYFSDIEFNYVDASLLTSEELAGELRKFRSDEINFYLIFSETKDGMSNIQDRTDFINANVSVPLFSANKIELGDWFVGGYVYSHYFAGKMTGSIANAIFDGNDVTLLSLNLASSSQYYLDYKLAKRFAFDLSSLPNEGSLVWMNAENDLWTSNRSLAISLVVIGCVLGVLIVAAILVSVQFMNKNKRLRSANNELNESKQQIYQLSKTDYLTGLNNAREFHTDLNKFIGERAKFHLMIIDIDNFKSINDLFGHKVGDEVVSSVGSALKKFSSDKLSVYRFGGDEFTIIFRDSSFIDADKIATRINDFSKTKLKVGSNNLNVHFSIGIAYYSGDKSTEGEIISNADSAMYFIKQNKKNGHAFFNPETMKNVKDSSLIGDELEKAIEKNRVYMVFQPAYRINQDKFVAFESLMRIEGISFGPADFIPIAEHSNLMIKLGRIAVKQSLEFLSTVNKAGYKDIEVAVNYSAVQMADDKFFQFIDEQMNLYNVKPSDMIIELTESESFNNNNFLKEFENKCKSRGIKLALDDFGSGYSSIRSLSKVSYDFVKYDKDIIDHMFDDLSIGNLINFCHGFGCKIVAEGVETKKQLDYLTENHCDTIQGYYFSRPLKKEDALEFLIKNTKKP